jgi:hypothetical protein
MAVAKRDGFNTCFRTFEEALFQCLQVFQFTVLNGIDFFAVIYTLL